jgi:pimeloyl-ACP methyl ester carboxylesterase
MTKFLDVRALWGSGDVSDVVQRREWIGGNNYTDHSQYAGLSPDDLQSYIHAKDVLIATHGFNVDREDGIAHLCEWQKLLGPNPFPGAFLGLLWPGDSESLHALSYPEEPKNATAAGNMIADFVDKNFTDATSISFVSHSLGARVVLQAVSKMTLPVRRLILMAGAISDHCLTKEFASVQKKVDVISALASKKDEVLRWAFPIGDIAAEIIDHDHPWWESALGRFGPTPRPDHYRSPCQIPKGWDFGHGNYLQVDTPPHEPIPPPVDVPLRDSQPPGPYDATGKPVKGWQEAWSASFVSTRFS